jgi:hypothetical protein
MMPQLQIDETKTVAVEPAVPDAQADALESGTFNEQAAEVEEIRTDEASTGKTKSQKHITEKKEDPNPLLLDPYEFDRCTITIVYTCVSSQQASVSVHNHKDDPIVKIFALIDVPLSEQIDDVMKKLLEIWPDGRVSATLVLLPVEGEAERRMVVSVRAGSDTPIVLSGPACDFPLPIPITTLLDELKELLPARAMKKIEKEAKEKSKPAVAKMTAPTPAKIAPVKVDGKTQMTLF